jgi:hypothetical protein
MDTSSKIIERYTAHSGDHYAVGREMGITPHDVMKVVRGAEHTPIDGIHFVVPVRPRPTAPGRTELRSRIISIRHQDEAGWPVEDRSKIERARDMFDRGMVELAQARVGGWVIQYAFPRTRKARNRAPWFTPLNVLVLA